MFSDGTVRLHLKTMSGPGHFALWHTDALGNAVVSMNTRDGIDDRDLRLLQAGSHAHVNWAFTAPGLYRLGFEASGILSQTSETVRSGIVEFLFEVYEAPSLSLSFGDNGMITLRWNSLEHHFYQLQSMADAFQGWSDHPCSAAVEGTGDAVSLEIDLGEGTRFFRLAMRGEDHHHPEAE
jgi:surface-anchored protein